MVTRTFVEWSSNQCPANTLGGNTTITDVSTSYTISHLRPATSYNVSLVASNSAGTSSSDKIVVLLEKTG